MGKHVYHKVKCKILVHSVLQEEGEDENNDILSPYHDDESNGIFSSHHDDAISSFFLDS